MTTIDLWDTDRIGNDVEFHYVTPEMSDDDECLKVRVSEDELLQHIADFEMNETGMDDERFLLDAFEDVKDSYWLNYLHIKLVSSYNEAKAFLHSYVSTHPVLSKKEELYVLDRVKSLYGITLKQAV